MLPAPELSIYAPRILLLSLHPVYAKRFFDRTKKVELRRTRPRLAHGDLVLFYVSSPVQAIGGGGRVDQVLTLSPEVLWSKVGKFAGINKEGFDSYFHDCELGYGILFSEVWHFEPAVLRSTIKQGWPDFNPPQLYRYLTAEDAKRLGVQVREQTLSLLSG